ncbi:MAG: hypothetical protein HY023_13545 [Chloroflexi bacterium]|nr:hypothetical protein [Chloroflexota bacterium]
MTHRLTARDGLTLVGLCGLLFSVYLFTFSGRYISNDELFLMDTTESLARRGSIFLTETGSLKWPGETAFEPLQPLLAAPLFWIANQLPFVGNVHGVMLFNVLVAVATAALVYLFVRALDYARRASLAASLAYGLATIAWPYSKNFFREPLTGLMLFATAYLLLRWRRAAEADGRPALIWLVLATLVGGLSLLAKEAMLIALPVLLVVFVPWSAIRRGQGHMAWRIVAAVAGAVLLAVGGLWFYQEVLRAGLERYSSFSFWSLEHRQIDPALLPALVGFVASPGKSLFLYSPICALAFVPLAGRPTAGRRRIDAVWPLLLLTAFIVAYSLRRGELWWGGTGWGPRYMVPVTPFLIVAAAPVFEYALSGGARWWARAGLAAILAAGLLVQIAGVSVFPLDYYKYLEDTGAGVAWTVGLWNPAYSAIVAHWRLIGAGLPDFAWARALPSGPDWISAGLIVVSAIGFAALLVWAGRRAAGDVPRRTFLAAGLAGLASLAFLTGFVLWRIYPDRRYQGGNESLQSMRQYWQNADLPGKALYLNNATYFDFVANYAKDNTLFYTLPFSPGDQLAPGASPPSPSTDPDKLVFVDAHSIVDYFPSFHRTAGLLMESGPYHAGVVRSIEWWMAETYYHIGTREFAPDVRLVLYSTARAPQSAALPAHFVDDRLGESIWLVGYDVDPDQPALRPGEILNVSVAWEAAAPVENYTASVDLIGPDGSLILQHDSYPVAGFWPTSAFVPGKPVRDNVAYILPRDLAPGRYEVWALMYDSAVRRLPVTDVAGKSVGDHVVLFSILVK